MSNYSVKFYPETIRFVTFTDIAGASGSYIPIGQTIASTTNNSYGFLNPIRLFHIEDTTDVQLWFSLDGINDHYTLVTNSFLLIDVCSNRSDMGEVLEIAQGSIMYVRCATGGGSSNPTFGGVFLSTSYAK